MNEVGLESLVLTLDPENRGGRRDIDTFATALRELVPGIDPADVPALVIATIDLGRVAGHWAVAKSTVRRGRSTFPKSIVLVRNTRETDKRRTVGVPLRHELAGWATALELSSTQRTVLLKVNEWLRRTNGGQAPVIAAAERAYELLRDEKAFVSTPPLGGETLWRGDRLTFDLLRCVRIPTPLTWEPVTSAVGAPGAMVCVENHATFRTLIRILRTQATPTWVAVAWIQGRNTAPLETLPSLPFQVTRFDYLGDLDVAGLQIATTACAIVDSLGIPAGPAGMLWNLLVEQPSRPGGAVNPDLLRELVGWLPAGVRERCFVSLTQGRVIPQEALRYDILEQAAL